MPLVLTLLTLFSFEDANAGWWRRFCREYIIRHDPYQYEVASVEWVTNEMERLAFMQSGGYATEDDLEHLEILRNELMWRKRKAELSNEK